MYPKSFKDLLDCLCDLPGIGEKSAERLAFHIINYDEEKLSKFSVAFLNIKNNLKKCSICHNISDFDICPICNNKERKSNILFIVEKPKDIVLFEKLGIYNGKYHVLDGLISPMDGINPEDININSLLKRIDNGDVNEIILALKPSIEGETTMQYIKKILENSNIKITKIATGIPIGTEIEYIDNITLEMALEERKELS